MAIKQGDVSCYIGISPSYSAKILAMEREKELKTLNLFNKQKFNDFFDYVSNLS
jgi:hypothetical protein